MKIVVIGGTGLIGTSSWTSLRRQGHEVVPRLTRHGRQHHHGRGAGRGARRRPGRRRRGELALFEDRAVLEFFETSGRNLLAAEAAAGVRHHVALSVVGSDRLPDSGYLRAKLAQERLIKASGIPYTILRSTQFFEFMSGSPSRPPTARRFAFRRPCCSPCVG